MRLASLVFTATIFLLSFLIGGNSIAGAAEEQVCDVGADYSLGVEDYSEAIRRHIQVLNEHPDNALAHYHLGFALEWRATGWRKSESINEPRHLG